MIGGIFLDKYYFRPSIIQEDGMFDAMLRGLATQPQQSEDTFFSVTVSVAVHAFELVNTVPPPLLS